MQLGFSYGSPFHQGMSTLTVLHSKICEDKDAPVQWQRGKQQPQPAHAREMNLPTKKSKTSRYRCHMNGRPSKGIFVLHKDRHSSLISGLYAAAHTLRSPVSIFAHGLIHRIKDAAIVTKKSICGRGWILVWVLCGFFGLVWALLLVLVLF